MSESGGSKSGQPVTLLELARGFVEDSALWVDGGLPFAASIHDGDPRVLVVVGENCSGKSFFVECLRSWAKNDEVVNICVSIRERTGAGTFDMSGLRRSMMFGDESVHSTGATSVGVIERAFGNMDSRHESGHRCLLVLDEPEIGLSEGYARAMGTWLAQKAMALPASSSGVAIVTHSRPLVRALAECMPRPPALANLGSRADLDAWLKTPEVKSVEDLLALQEVDHRRWREVQDALENRRKPTPAGGAAKP